MIYHLKPEGGWKTFEHHDQFINHIFNTFTPLVNQKTWHYMNLVAGTSMFEDEEGNLLIITFRDDEGKKIDEMSFSKPSPESKISASMSQMLVYLMDEYKIKKEIRK